ncbi:uncharacterized protein LY89DRAFT_681470 [Mollisia scopiformis]|uniref:EH domain-containing protein n=1 Tax=Mollisia scopiformis TaxID=149040 RepID=A0A194XPP8_MOLSC|nr:uncharacterized protein LY89DRAFT_681470 [Mollisia scopiformis]KUJ22163.1 hypothetical protein LY89DRAFT_681470 [Mollisia scopiformis]
MTADRPKPQDFRLGNVAPSNVNDTQNAALRGASLAFGKPPVKPTPKLNDYAGTNGAMAAAKAGAGRAAASRNASSSSSRWEEQGVDDKLAYHNTGSSAGGRSYTMERPSIQQRLSHFGGGAGYLQPPGGTPDQSRSASFIAATLAASRSASVSPNPTGQSHTSNADMRRPQSFMARSPSVRSVASSKSSDQALDTTSIPPTTSLIGMFEQKDTSPTRVKRPAAKRSATSASVRKSLVTSSPGSAEPSRSHSPSPLSARPKTSAGGRPKLTLAQIQKLSEESEARKPSPPARKPSIPASKPIPIPAKRNPKLPSPEVEKEEGASSDDSFVSASDYKPSFRAELAQQRRLTSASTQSLDTQATIDSMANAIVASSLASSRAASPSRSSLQSSFYPPPPPPRRNGRQHHLFHGKDKSRTPSPAKPVGLRMTMRKSKSKDSLDEGEKRRGKKNLVKKHPNKHHEGDRKRWRDAVTERERKRYEAVWASNKGLYSDGSPGSEYCVCSLVVRDIFSRSRLHVDVLEEVYALVDRSCNGMLEREEFVVGLWLIDQRLKGRKLPIRVSDSVWKSVGSLGGIKVKKAGR